MTKIISEISSEDVLDGRIFLNSSLNLNNRGMIITLIAALNTKHDATIADLPGLTGLTDWEVRTGLAALAKAGYLVRKQINATGKMDWEHVLVAGTKNRE